MFTTIAAWVIANPALSSVIGGAIYEVAIRLLPTKYSGSILKIATALVDAIIQDKKKDGGAH